MRPKHHILLCAPDSRQASVLKIVLESRLLIHVKLTEGLGLVAALHERAYHCAVLLKPYPMTLRVLKKHEVPTLAVGKMESSADRIVSDVCMAEVIEAVKTMCARKRGPRKVAA